MNNYPGKTAWQGAGHLPGLLYSVALRVINQNV